MSIITEDLKYRKKLCEYANNHKVTKVTIRYKTNRQFVYRQLARYDGTLESLKLKSTKPKSHPNQHTEEEINLIIKVVKRYRNDGFAEVHVQLVKRGYQRSYGSMCKKIRRIKLLVEKLKPKIKRKRRHIEVRGEYPGDKVQVDIKYIPQECIAFDSYGTRYYQITGIDEYSRKRILAVVDEKNITYTSKFVSVLEEKMGFKINTIQTDNGSEFTVVHPDSEKESEFEKVLR